MKTLSLLLLLVTTVASAQTVLLDHSSLRNGTYILTKSDSGIAVDPTPITTVRPGVVPVPPVVPPVVVPPVVGSLADVVKAATASIPDYPDKATHRRAMAFGMSFLAQATSNTEVSKARATVRQFCDAATGADASKWSGWWQTVDAKLNTSATTPAAYTAALGEMATALTADLPPTAESNPATAYGVPSFGLSPEFLNFLMTVLLPLLMKLLGLAVIAAGGVLLV